MLRDCPRQALLVQFRTCFGVKKPKKIASTHQKNIKLYLLNRDTPAGPQSRIRRLMEGSSAMYLVYSGLFRCMKTLHSSCRFTSSLSTIRMKGKDRFLFFFFSGLNHRK